MRTEAVEIGVRAVINFGSWNGYSVDEEDRGSLAEDMGVVFDAWFSPQSVPCSEPDCRDGFIPWGSGEPWVEEGSDPCPKCVKGQVSSPPLAVLMGELEQVGWGYYFGPDSESQWQLVNGPTGSSVQVFRLRSGEDT